MPNGGSDCCGTCPFNRKNRGAGGYAHAADSDPDYCEIRDLAVEGPAFWTYCANHPGHNPNLIRVPIGPVYTHGEATYNRVVWRPGPNTPEVRAEILRLLTAATPEPINDYPAGLALVEAAILQAGDIGDSRFAPQLDRIRKFPGFADGVSRAGFPRDPANSASLAAESLAHILPPAEITPLINETVRAIATSVDQSEDRSGLPVLADALQEAGCSHAPTLEYLRNPDARTPNWVVDVILGRIVHQPS